MIQMGGNPFISNKMGDSIESLVGSLCREEEDIKNQILAEINAFKTSFPPSEKEGLVHSAVRQNNLKLAKVLQMLGASFDSYNNKRERPLDIAIDNKCNRMAVFVLNSMDRAVEEEDKAKKYSCFINSLINSEEFPDILRSHCSEIIKTFQEDSAE